MQLPLCPCERKQWKQCWTVGLTCYVHNISYYVYIHILPCLCRFLCGVLSSNQKKTIVSTETLRWLNNLSTTIHTHIWLMYITYIIYTYMDYSTSRSFYHRMIYAHVLIRICTYEICRFLTQFNDVNPFTSTSSTAASRQRAFYLPKAWGRAGSRTMEPPAKASPQRTQQKLRAWSSDPLYKHKSVIKELNLPSRSNFALDKQGQLKDQHWTVWVKECWRATAPLSPFHRGRVGWEKNWSDHNLSRNGVRTYKLN